MSKRYELEPGVVDLDVSEVYDTKGNRIDNAYVERAVAEVHGSQPADPWR